MDTVEVRQTTNRTFDKSRHKIRGTHKGNHTRLAIVVGILALVANGLLLVLLMQQSTVKIGKLRFGDGSWSTNARTKADRDTDRIDGRMMNPIEDGFLDEKTVTRFRSAGIR